MFLGLYSPAEPAVKALTLLVSCCVFMGITPVPRSFARERLHGRKTYMMEMSP